MSIFSLMRDSVHNAHHLVKAKCTEDAVHNAQMAKKTSDEVLPDQAIRLRQAREARGFATAAAACNFFGWVYDTYAQHENGNRGLRRDVAKRYGVAYGVTAGWLLTGEGVRAIQKQPARKSQWPTRSHDGDMEWLKRLLTTLTPDELPQAREIFDEVYPDITEDNPKRKKNA